MSDPRWTPAHQAAWRRAMGLDPTPEPEFLPREPYPISRRSKGTAAGRIALQRALERVGWPVSLVTIHTWSRDEQGAAYQWATAFAAGREELPPPECVRREFPR